MSAPTVIDQRYSLVKVLGKGMSGQVMLVNDGEAEMALKFLNQVQLNVSRDEALASFKREFSILKELNHPNIAKILDFGFDESFRKYYFTSELVLGKEFHEACAGASFETLEKLFVQVLRALNYLHARGVYHFDIKPQNVLVAMQDGVPVQAKIIDFGLAGFSSPDKKIGTPAYMAPEIIQGGFLDGRADLYSFGVMAYRLLTGVNPFACKTLKETFDKQLTFTPSPASHLNAAVPRYWDHILARLLEKDPVQRYSQASIVIRDLNFLSGKEFEVETHDTKLSYLPERGTLIARDEQWQSFLQTFDGVFLAETPATDRIFIIQGKKGTGKSRLLSEIKYYSQLKMVPVKTLTQYRSEKRPERYLLSLDDASLTPDQVNALAHELADQRVLLAWATEQAPRNWSGAVVVQVEHYTQLQLKQYIESVTGLTQAPQSLIAEIYQRTQGNPLLVTEFIKSLLANDLLFDKEGKWDAKTFDDIRIDFNRVHIPQSMDEYLATRVRDYTPEETEALRWIAINKAPLSLFSIRRLTSLSPVEAILQRLVESDTLTYHADMDAYNFTNPILARIFRKGLPLQERQSYHARLARICAEEGGLEKTRLYHVSRSAAEAEACAAYQSLGDLLLEESDFAGAEASYRRWLELLPGPDARSERILAQFKLGKALVNGSSFAEAEEIFNAGLKTLSGELTRVEEILILYQGLVDLRFRQHECGADPKALEKAEAECAAALALVTSSVKGRMWYVIFKNYEANLLFKNKNVDAALAEYQETYAIWKSELSQEDRQRVVNNRLHEVYTMQKNYAEAIDVCREHVAVFESSRHRVHLMRYTYALANAYYNALMKEKHNSSHDLEEQCITHYLYCERLAREIQNYSCSLRALNGIGLVYMQRQDKTTALDYYKRALAVARKAGQMEMAGLIAYNIATIYKDQDNPREAYSYLVYAINTFEGQTALTPYTEFINYLSYLVLADVNLCLGACEAAEQAIRKSNDILERSALARDNIFRWSLVNARYHYELDNAQEGDSYLEQARAQADTPEKQATVNSFLESTAFQKLKIQVLLRATGTLSQQTSVAWMPSAQVKAATVSSSAVEDEAQSIAAGPKGEE